MVTNHTTRARQRAVRALSKYAGQPDVPDIRAAAAMACTMMVEKPACQTLARQAAEYNARHENKPPPPKPRDRGGRGKGPRSRPKKQAREPVTVDAATAPPVRPSAAPDEVRERPEPTALSNNLYNFSTGLWGDGQPV